MSEKINITIHGDVKFHELDTALIWILQYRKKGYSGLVGFRSPAGKIQGGVKENKNSVSLYVERIKINCQECQDTRLMSVAGNDGVECCFCKDGRK